MVSSRDQHPGQNHNIKMGNTLFDWVEELKYLITTVKIEIASAKKFGACGSRGMLAIVRCSLLSKYVKIYKIIILSVVLFGRENWSPTLREERRLREREIRVLRRIFGPKRDEVMGGENCIMRSLIIYTPYPILCG